MENSTARTVCPQTTWKTRLRKKKNKSEKNLSLLLWTLSLLYITREHTERTKKKILECSSQKPLRVFQLWRWIYEYLSSTNGSLRLWLCFRQTRNRLLKAFRYRWSYLELACRHHLAICLISAVLFCNFTLSPSHSTHSPSFPSWEHYFFLSIYKKQNHY